MRSLVSLLLPFSLIANPIITESILFPQGQPAMPIALEGLYEEREIPYVKRYPDGSEVQYVKTILTFTPLDTPIYGNSTLSLDNKIVSQNQKTIPFFLIGSFSRYDEFSPLLGKKVFIEGSLEPSNDLFFSSLPQIHLNYIAEIKWKDQPCQHLSYEPAEVTLEGQISIRDSQNTAITYILTLDNPVHINLNTDEFHESEMYVTEIQIFPPQDISSDAFIDKRARVTGQLYHSDSPRNRRILCDVTTLLPLTIQ